jgi:two-component system, OmpR family, alkaline phosphatase synthesis response regulator PhoP
MLEHNRILVVEDDPAVARGLDYGLQAEGFVVLLADTGKKALELARHENVHLVLLDVRLPELNGFDVLRQLRAEGKKQPIIMVTARDEESDKVLGLELGADDYIVKPFSLRELHSRIRSALRRAYGDLATVSNERATFGDIEIDLERLLVSKAGQPVLLTPTEFKLLRHLLANPNLPFGREALIEAIWGYGSAIEDDRTIDAHMRHLREKIEDDPSEPRWLVTVRGVGYKFKA